MVLYKLMNGSDSSPWVPPRRAAVVFCFMFLVMGCGESGSRSGGYDHNLRYLMREDALILRLPEVHPSNYPPQGDPDAHLAKYPSWRGEIRLPKVVALPSRQALHQALEETFGTPAQPKWPPGWDYTNEDLTHGSRVYSRICRNCHGLNGDGRGAGGLFMSPSPRDFRSGQFNTAMGTHKPHFDDLLEVVRHGVPNSTMQAFDLISDHELRAATQYAILLSVRGEVEQREYLNLIQDESETTVEEVPARVRQRAERLRQQWQSVEQVAWPQVTVEATPDSIRRGLQLFTQGQNCTSCHEDFGRKESYRHNIWGGVTRVADLTRGEFRWGRSPERLAGRIRYGIPGVGMPAHPTLTDSHLADLTAFVKELSQPERLPPDVRQVVYPASK